MSLTNQFWGKSSTSLVHGTTDNLPTSSYGTFSERADPKFYMIYVIFARVYAYIYSLDTLLGTPVHLLLNANF